MSSDVGVSVSMTLSAASHHQTRSIRQKVVNDDATVAVLVFVLVDLYTKVALTTDEEIA